MTKYYEHRQYLNIDLISEITNYPTLDNIDAKIEKIQRFLLFLKEEELLLKTYCLENENHYAAYSFLSVNTVSQKSAQDLLDMLIEFKQTKQ